MDNVLTYFENARNYLKEKFSDKQEQVDQYIDQIENLYSQYKKTLDSGSLKFFYLSSTHLYHLFLYFPTLSSKYSNYINIGNYSNNCNGLFDESNIPIIQNNLSYYTELIPIIEQNNFDLLEEDTKTNDLKPTQLYLDIQQIFASKNLGKELKNIINRACVMELTLDITLLKNKFNINENRLIDKNRLKKYKLDDYTGLSKLIQDFSDVIDNITLNLLTK